MGENEADTNTADTSTADASTADTRATDTSTADARATRENHTTFVRNRCAWPRKRIAKGEGHDPF